MIKSPLLLSIDNSSKLCSVTISDNSFIVYSEIVEEFSTSEYILKKISKMMIDNSISFRNINAIVYGCGPGDFTGIRVSSVIAQGLSVGWKIPIIRIPSILAMVLEMSYIYKSYYFFVAINFGIKHICYNMFINNNHNIKPISNCLFYNTESLDKIFLKKVKIVGTTNISSAKINLFKKNNPYLVFEDRFFPKALYLDLLSRKCFFNSSIITPNKAVPIYFESNLYKKYDSYL